ncbi:MAG: hypothetical protein IPL78_26325 [Chloroflexi bacterium]|nr:hypothetical protein [Chloroflexota bacterium]
MVDPHFLPLPSTLPAESLPLTVGLYDLITLERLTVVTTGQDVIPLLSITPLR